MIRLNQGSEMVKPSFNMILEMGALEIIGKIISKRII